MKNHFLGPIICTADLSAWTHLLTTGFDLKQVAREKFSASETETLWGLKNNTVETAVFETPDTPFGIRVLQCSPGSGIVIRDQASGYDCNALKVIDFYAPDFERACTKLAHAGYQLKGEIAEYEFDGRVITEGHLWGPDAVVCAVISGSPSYLHQFVTVTDRNMSEILAVSAPVDCQDTVVRFYQHLGLKDVYRYEVTDKSFQQLVGANSPLHIRAINMGADKKEPYFGVIHYGLPSGEFRSLRHRAQLPNRGLVGATLTVTNIGSAHDVCKTHNYEVVAEPVKLTLLPYGLVTSMSVVAPHGVLHQLMQLDKPYHDIKNRQAL